jgi:Protein of unknown function (DUF1570)
MTRFPCHILLITGLATMLPAAAVAASDQPDTSDSAVEYLQRRQQLTPDDADQRLALADWCEARDLVWEAVGLYREVLTLRPDDDQAYESLVHLTDTHRLPEDDQRQQKLLEQFSGMKLHVTDHFLIVYDTDQTWALNRAALLEKAHDVFYATFSRAGFKPLPLSQRLVCLLYADHDEYLNYARTVDHADMGWAGGYYSVRSNRITFFDDRQNPQFADVQKHIADLDTVTADLRHQIRNAPTTAEAIEARRKLEAAMKEQDFYRNRVNAIAGFTNTAKTVHEATHQLAFNSGIQRRDVGYPFWLAEGIATNFETEDPAKPFGPLQPNLIRREGVRRMLADNQLIPLNIQVAVGSAPSDDQQLLSDLYDQTWALFGFIYRYHRDELRQYLDSFNHLDHSPRGPQQLREQFTDAFGDIDALQTQFRKYLERLP